MYKRIMTTFALLTAGFLHAVEIHPDLSMKLDGNIESEGKLVPYKISSLNTPPEFMEGISGKALLIEKNPRNGISLVFNDNFPAKSGSISFWICPLDWNAEDGKMHIFMTGEFYPGLTSMESIKTAKPTNTFSIYKYANPAPKMGGLGILWFYHDSKTSSVCSRNAKMLGDWQEWRWHNITIVWETDCKDKFLRKLYIDGEFISILSSNFDFSGVSVLTFGATWGDQGKSLIDEINVNARVLSEEEIAENYSKTMENKNNKVKDK